MTAENVRYRVFTIVERQDDKPFWLNIGMAYPHSDGKGFNLRLQALPLKGRMALRVFDENPNAASEAERDDRFSPGDEGK